MSSDTTDRVARNPGRSAKQGMKIGSGVMDVIQTAGTHLVKEKSPIYLAKRAKKISSFCVDTKPALHIIPFKILNNTQTIYNSNNNKNIIIERSNQRSLFYGSNSKATKKEKHFYSVTQSLSNSF